MPSLQEVLLCFAGLVLFTRGSDVELEERTILEHFFDRNLGTQWERRDGWKTKTSPCMWHGITCITDQSNRSRIRRIHLADNNVVGDLEPKLFELHFLKDVLLDSNPITDAGFVGTGNSSSKLESFHCNSCFMDNLRGLEHVSSSMVELGLASNSFRSFPTELWQLTRLERLDFGYQKIKGIIPSTIGLLTSLVELKLVDSHIRGEIPSTVGELRRLTHLDLSRNFFSGTIPSDIEKLSALQELRIEGFPRASTSVSHGGLSGSLPSLATMPDLTRVHLGFQQFSGSIPSDFLQSLDLTTNSTVYIDIQENLLNGTIPNLNLDTLSRLNLELGGNDFVAPFPESWCKQKQWMSGLVERFGCDAILCGPGTYNENRYRQGDSSQPCVTCKVQTEEEAMLLGRTLCAGENGASMSELQILFELYAMTEGGRWKNRNGWRSFDVVIRANFFGQHVTLPPLDVCSLHGVLCDGEGRVYLIQLSDNGLTGAVPRSLFTLPELRELDLSHNTLSVDFSTVQNVGRHLSSVKLQHIDTVSVEGISRLPSLKHIYFDGTDSTPESLQNWSDLWNLTGLETLHLASCSLLGDLPSRLTSLTALQR